MKTFADNTETVVTTTVQAFTATITLTLEEQSALSHLLVMLAARIETFKPDEYGSREVCFLYRPGTSEEKREYRTISKLELSLLNQLDDALRGPHSVKDRSNDYPS